MKISGFYKINKQSVFYSSFLLFISSVILHILGFLYRIILSRNIGADGMGLFSLVMPVYAVLSSLVISGLSLSVTKLSAQSEKNTVQSVSKYETVSYNGYLAENSDFQNATDTVGISLDGAIAADEADI